MPMLLLISIVLQRLCWINVPGICVHRWWNLSSLILVGVQSQWNWGSSATTLSDHHLIHIYALRQHYRRGCGQLYQFKQSLREEPGFSPPEPSSSLWLIMRVVNSSPPSPQVYGDRGMFPHFCPSPHLLVFHMLPEYCSSELFCRIWKCTRP